MGDTPPPLFDLHLYPEGVSDLDLESMRFFGVEAALATTHYALPAVTPKKLLGQFERLISIQLPRLERAGIRGYAAVGLDPRSLPRRGLGEVLQQLPHFFQGGKVVALWTGLYRGGEAEEEVLHESLRLARRLNLPVLVQTPQHRKAPITRRLLSLLQGSGVPPHRLLVNHADGKTLRPIRACGHFAGLTLHPDALSGERAVAWVRKLGSEGLVINSEMGSGAGDLTALARAVNLMNRMKLSQRLIARVRWTNARDFLRLED